MVCMECIQQGVIDGAFEDPLHSWVNRESVGHVNKNKFVCGRDVGWQVLQAFRAIGFVCQEWSSHPFPCLGEPIGECFPDDAHSGAKDLLRGERDQPGQSCGVGVCCGEDGLFFAIPIVQTRGQQHVMSQVLRRLVEHVHATASGVFSNHVSTCAWASLEVIEGMARGCSGGDSLERRSDQTQSPCGTLGVE